MGFANDFGMGPTWFQIRDPHGTYLGQHGSYTGYHYGALLGFVNDFFVGPTWVQILDPHKTYLGQHVANSGYNYGAHMGFANYFDMSHVRIRRPTFILKFPQNEMVFLFMSPALSSQNVGLLRLGDY